MLSNSTTPLERDRSDSSKDASLLKSSLCFPNEISFNDVHTYAGSQTGTSLGVSKDCERQELVAKVDHVTSELVYCSCTWGLLVCTPVPPLVLLSLRMYSFCHFQLFLCWSQYVLRKIFLF